MIKHEDIDDGKLYQKLHKVSWCTWLCPAESIPPCNSLFHPCRKAVSTKKRRFFQSGFDLDLVYLSDRIIVHGFPAVGLEHVYRNPRYEIKRLLELKHKGHYKVFNFCCEPGRGYDPRVFEGRVERYPFKDHNTPPLETLAAFGNNAKFWLDQDPANVCSLHCKAGKGRAGLMSCVLLFRSGVCSSAKEALDHYDRERVINNRGLTVTSQRKFVMFYEALWRDHWGVKGNLGEIPGENPDSNIKWVVPEQPVLPVFGVDILDAPPGLLKNVRIRIFKGTNFKPVLKYDTGKGQGDALNFSCEAEVQGNFKIEVYAKKKGFLVNKVVKVMELWHNTLFMNKNATYIDFDKSQIDVKRAFKKIIGDTITLRVYLVRPSAGEALSKGYNLIRTEDDTITLGDSSPRKVSALQMAQVSNPEEKS